VLEVIAEPNRRSILSLLVSSQQSVGEIERQLRMPQPTVSKHLRVLRDAGFVESTVDAQRRLYRLKPEPLQEVDDWLAPFRRFWSAHLDALERHLDHMASPEEPDGTELQLALNNNPAAKAYQQAMFQQQQPAAMFFTDDIQGDYERIKARGAEFTMPPTDVTGSTIAMLNDTCGNFIQLTQLARYSR
jgi:DNA-binding transcriptional ArsR family regulator/predicted enzyme related to lactoylglutathione lyase